MSKSNRLSSRGTSFGDDPRQGLMSSRSGGAVQDELHGPAFTHVSPHSMPLPVLIAVPHAGRVYPAETLAQMRDSELSQLRLEDRYVDLLGVEIAKATGAGLLVAHAPRAMLDLNRAHDDVDWEMIDGPARRSTKPEPVLTGTNRRARSGLGLVPRRLPGFGEIWRQRLTRDELDRRIDSIHRPYHAFLARELERIRDEWGAALLIDLHSMPPLRRQSGQDHAPQIVLGDRFGSSCHHSLITRACRFLEGNGKAVAHNRPYSGGYVLDRHASPVRGIHAAQVEMCRSTYLDDRLSEPSDALRPLANMLAGLVRELGAETAHLAAGGRMAQAAE
ncbi:N-formylglutamate amidohydrolase [Erythrobacter crassostreae]|uniref:N-formylglutamate amidohydrolase n=1 Tax=Erythrobacter crassostreae TaxID=2828328 RepID=A0A9X1JP55_9SPHN|nr:N-formylglutamate amidohydrolase [Erythrobacter crassostrea]MBV7260363.1 N-formylglutamate amidohydrolase [Erythrobacter crassostrea]